MYSLIVFGIAIVFILVMLDIFKDRESEKLGKLIKILAASFSVIGVLKFLLADAFVECVFDFADPIEAILRWTYYIGFAVLPIAAFFDTRLFRNVAIYFSLPVSVIAAILFERNFAYYLMDGSNGIHLPPALRYTMYILELAMAIVIPILILINTKHRFAVRDKREWLNFLVSIPLMMLQMMPAYMPQATVGFGNISTASFSTLHLGWILLLIAEGIILHYVFRGKSEKEKYILLVFLVIAQFYHTNSIFLRGFTLHRLPLQLCSIAAYFYVYTIFTRNKKFFNFCYIVNLVGGAIAIALAAFSPDSLCFWNLHYMYEHTFVMLVPILAVSLGIFEAPIKKEALFTSLKIFAIYFLLSFAMGILINGFDPGDDYAVNFFYMFDLKVALEYIPFAGFTGALHVVMGEFEFYPILVAVIFCAFVSFFVLFYFALRGGHALFGKLKKKKADALEKAPALK